MAGKPLFNPKGIAAARESVERFGLNRPERSLPESNHTVAVARNTGLSPTQEVGITTMFALRKKEAAKPPVDVGDIKAIAKAMVPGGYLADAVLSAVHNSVKRAEYGSQRYEPSVPIGHSAMAARTLASFELSDAGAAKLRSVLVQRKMGVAPNRGAKELALLNRVNQAKLKNQIPANKRA